MQLSLTISARSEVTKKMGGRSGKIQSLIHSLDAMFRCGDDEFDCSFSPDFVERLGPARMAELYRLFAVLAAEHGYDMQEVGKEGGARAFLFSCKKKEHG